MISIEHLTKSFGQRTVFQDLSLQFTEGKVYALIGNSGCGKTTLLESIMQLIKYQGDVYFENQRLTKIKHAAKHMYLVYQNPELQF
ncbi:MAG: ATP-binding cassette domain-containing protein, partial [Streptococcus parasanguinis]|nr:ATP-binding cassette domain-containing protein [Streptococcus parasanguinis]